jgi:ATP-dependent DNA helicase RecQ
MTDRGQALDWLRAALEDDGIEFRDGQWEAVDELVNRRGRVLVVQRTGWGKSMVYFLAAKALRDQGLGPTLIISPLLALMRNQIQAAQRIGLRPATINSSNTDEWEQVRARLFADQIDLLLISPERLANDEFVEETLLPIAGRIGLLVVDEAHCISDWGHDFRPDYRRIVQVLRQLPGNIAVLATTATANRRVVADIALQIGGDLRIQRGPLMRESLRLQHIRLPNPAARLAWLADNIPPLPGSGIIYTLTVRDAERVAAWLQEQGISAAAYYGDVESAHREELEQRLLANQLKCLVATTALGMGYDKPDLGFVVHFQAPGSVVFYYQQVGRAGRAIAEAYGILLSGAEDDDINEYFRETAFPPEWQIEAILRALEHSDQGLTVRELESAVNLRQSHIEKVLKLLVVESAAPVVKMGSRWARTLNPFTLDKDRVEHLTHQREREWAEMKRYMESETCLMQFLAQALDDDMAEPCGRCAVCAGHPVVPLAYSRERLLAAQRRLRQSEIPLEPKRQWDAHALVDYGWIKATIPPTLRAEEGRILSRWAEPVWGKLVKAGKEEGRFSDELVGAAAEMIGARWMLSPPLRWVTSVPSLRHPDLVPNFAARLAAALSLPYYPVLHKVRETQPQKKMQNRYHQCVNLNGAFAVHANGIDISGPVLLVDDICDSGWTLTIASALLRQAGSGPVYPFALATTAPR